MRSELVAQHLALEALADPITPWPATVPGSSRAGAAWRLRPAALNPLRGLVMATMVQVRTCHRLGAGALEPVRRRFGFGKPRHKR